MSAFLRKYATATHIYIPMIKRAVMDFAVGADWTPAAGDVKVSIDGGAVANVATLPVAIASGNGAFWDFALSSGETTGKKITVTVVDAATKAVEDQEFVIETYGHASAELPPDFSNATSLGLADLDAAISSRMATFTLPTNFSSLLIHTSGQVYQRGVLGQGTLTAGTVSSVTLQSGQRAGISGQVGILITSGAAIDEFRILSPYNPSTGVGTPTVDFANAPGLATYVTIALPKEAPFAAADFGAGAIDANALATDAVTEIAAGIWNALVSGLTTASSIGKKLADWVLGSDSKVILSNNAHTGAVVPTVTTLTGNTAQTGDNFARLGAPAGASLSADVAAVKTDSGNLISRLGAFTGSGVNTILGFFRALLRKDLTAPSDVAGAFDPATDSVEALRDRGDAAWITGSAAPTAVAVRTEMDSNSTQLAKLGAPAGASISADIAGVQTGITTLLGKDAGYVKAVAVTGFMFAMTDTSNNPATGKTLTGQISKDSGVFAAIAGTISERGSGWYYVDLSGAEMNADEVAFKFIGLLCQQLNIKIRTQS